MTTTTRLRVMAVALLSALLTVTGVASADAKPHHARFPEVIDLPTGFLPEGITIGKGGIAYFGSRADGDIYAADLRTGQGGVISQGPGTPSVGLKVDRHGLLYVAGGPSGTGRLVSTRTGAILATYTFTGAPTFVNDVVLTRDTVWFTDSQRAQLYGVPRVHGRHGAISTTVTTRPLTGDWVQGAGFNANGITQTPDHKALLVVNSGSGVLYRVDPGTGKATKVDLGGTSLVNGDGMLLRGRILYVVQNQLDRIAVLRLDAAGTSGTLVKTITSAKFDVPTTVAAFRGGLYLPNARFGNATPGTASYTAVRVDR